MSYIESIRTQFEKNGFAMSKTRGVSMRPLIWEGAFYVVVVPLSGEPRVGDMLSFVQTIDGKECSFLHRLVEIRRDGKETIYVTRGDNCYGCEYLRLSQIFGRVAEVHRRGGWRPWYVIGRRKFTVEDRDYRLYVRLWSALWPLRFLYYRLRSALWRLIHR